MRVLGIETSSRRGSVAIVENDRLIARSESEGSGTHGEHVLHLIDRITAEAGFAPSSIDRVAVGIGPGSFTGLRVGIALAQGIAIGLDIPVFGVGSLEAMVRSVPLSRPDIRCAVLDARRNEVFFAAYDQNLNELLAPQALPWDGAARSIEAMCPGAKVFVGEPSTVLFDQSWVFRSPRSDLPDATDTALIGATRPIGLPGATPLYVRDADAKLPNLPRSPLAGER